MAEYVVKGESLSAIADAIREKTGETDALGLSEMPGAIQSIQAGGGDGSYEEGFAAGKQAEYDAFWDAYLAPVKRDGMGANLFSGRGWNENTIFPYKIDFITNVYQMFAYAGNVPKSEIAKIDFSKAVSGSNIFLNSIVTELPELNLSNMEKLQGTFSYTTYLVSIDKVVLKNDGSQTFQNAFGGATKLAEVRFEGVIGQNIDFSPCPLLTHDSLMSIIHALKDYEGSGTTHTVTLGATNLAKLTDGEKQIATQKGWTLA